ncbi:capsid cement protein [Stenotrophomonas maltophilia]|uniref:capsid cement protein n=1 Tax=Stenotrophomonas maltophilia TaxID=40324 RepID=UPI001F53977B|nr:capsid cement protein [Stenotrophomonas maltophilia]
MSQNIALLTLSVQATAALTHNRFVSPAGGVAAAGGNAYGVTRSDAEIGQLAPVDVLGTTQVTAGAAIVTGAALEVGVDGKAVTADAGKVVARAAPGAKAAADGDVLEVILIPN